MASSELITYLLTIAHSYLPYGTNESMKFAACFVAAYVFFRGLCVIINNACCRIIEWAQEEEEEERAPEGEVAKGSQYGRTVLFWASILSLGLMSWWLVVGSLQAN